MIDTKTLEILEFDKLLGVISGFAKGDAAKEAVLSLSPLNSLNEINKRLGLIEEIRLMSQKAMPLCIHSYPDIEPLLQKVRPAGAVLEPIELAGIAAFLITASSILEQIRESQMPLLNELVSVMTGEPEILKILKKSIGREGDILDSASFMLAELRREIKRLEGRIRKKLEEIVRDESIAVFLQDDFITQRSGRWVIPVRMDSKGQVQGVVHDVSRSGETAFIEPLGIISLSNELENLTAEAKTEEIRILREISSKIRAVSNKIDSEYRIVLYIDMLNSIAMFADELRMETPRINEQNVINIVRGRHPLLLLSSRQRDNRVVPTDVMLGGENNVMVITGPNAGGKTITIKTIGLLSLMALSGMPIPADSASNIPFVRDILVDIGDQQSIEDNLSTFSAHISNIAEILTKADSKSLVLIDELGTGTDPDEGAALACAILRELKKTGSLLFATTHLTDIKGFVHKEEGMLNASMEFDQKTLTPLYKLRVGEPGQSHAFETAKRFGIPPSIIESAKDILGKRKIELDNLIHDLNELTRQHEAALDAISKKEAELMDKERQIAEMKAEIERRQKEIFTNAYREASDIITAIKRQMYDFLEEIKKRDRERAREIIKRAESIHADITKKIKEYSTTERPAVQIDMLKVGDMVFVNSIGRGAKIIKLISNDRLRVKAGNIELEIPLSDIAHKMDILKEFKESGITVERPEEETPSELNIVGLRADDALSRLEPFLNHASLAGFSEVRIIHGLGAGILSKVVREHLARHPLIKKFRQGNPQEGGAGVTVAEFL